MKLKDCYPICTTRAHRHKKYLYQSGAVLYFSLPARIVAFLRLATWRKFAQVALLLSDL